MMLLSWQKDKGTSCLLVFLSVCLPSEIICVGYLKHENRICTNTDQWTVGVVVSETGLEQSVGNMSKIGQHFNSEHVELEEELDEEKRLLGQGRDFDTLIHHKETYLHLADTCNNALQRILRSIVETYYQIFPKYDKRALSLETGLGLGVELTGHILDFVPQSRTLPHLVKIVLMNVKNEGLNTFGVIKTLLYGDIVHQINY